MKVRQAAPSEQPEAQLLVNPVDQLARGSIPPKGDLESPKNSDRRSRRDKCGIADGVVAARIGGKLTTDESAAVVIGRGGELTHECAQDRLQFLLRPMCSQPT